VDNVARRYTEQNVPPDTSHPAATDFTAGIGASDHGAWLARFPTAIYPAAGTIFHKSRTPLTK